MTIGDSKSQFFKGSIHIVPPNIPHVKQSEAPFQDIFLQTDTISLFSSPGTAINCAFAFSDDEAQTLSHLMRSLLFRYLKGDKNDRILQSLYELILQIVEEQIKLPPEDPMIERLKQRLMLSFNDPECSVTAILHDMGYHPDYLRRRFSKETGLTPNQYLTSLRITHAKTLLEQKEMKHISVADVGVLCGYYDPHYFARIFKKETGYSPKEYTLNQKKEES